MNVDEKRRVHFVWGVTLELIADPETRIVEVHESEDRFERIDATTVETYSPASIPDLVLPLRAMFSEMDIPDIA